jgi:cytochrome c
MQLHILGGGGEDTTPPVTTCALTGTMQGGVYITDVTATLTATDDMSGVNYTMYKIDNGVWTMYSVPFIITGNGEHTIYFYSVDNAGNIETTKTSVFTIQYPLQITIKGGLGITATIKNNGTTDLTGLTWKIELSGGIILIGKTKTGTVDIAAGSSVTEKDFVFGFGKPTITVTAGDISATATGTVILFFVIGV